MAEYTDMGACLDACAGLSTKRSWLGFGTSPQGRCQATCGKTVRYQAGYGDPDEIFDVDLALDIQVQAEAAAWAGTPGTPAPDFSGIGNFGEYATTDQNLGPILFLALAAGGLYFVGRA